MKKATIPMALTIILLAATVVTAAPASQDGQEYIVQAGDWLSKIAGNVYDDILAYPAIVRATNAKALADDSFATISDPDRIEVGQKLWIPALDESGEALSLMDLMNFTYEGIYEQPVQLDNGAFQGEPFEAGGASRPTVTLANYAFGQLNDDGLEDAAVVLVENSGGSGSFYYLMAVVSQEGGFVNAATHLLGDRLRVQSLSVDEGQITLQTVTHGPDDPMCCPSLEMPYVYAFSGNILMQTSPKAPGMYKGFLPAATCCGRDITLYLNADATANLHSDYLNGEPVVVETGSWTYGAGGSVVLTLTGQADAPYETPVVITYDLGEEFLTPTEYDEKLYGSFGPGRLTRFKVLGWEQKAPPYDEAAAEKAVADSGFVGFYKGFLPAATCCGQDITLSLDWEGKATLRTDYLNGEAPFVEVGTWLAHDDGKGLTLTITGNEASPGVEARVYDQAPVWEFAWEDATLNKVESPELTESLGLRLFHMIGLVAATMGR